MGKCASKPTGEEAEDEDKDSMEEEEEAETESGSPIQLQKSYARGGEEEEGVDVEEEEEEEEHGYAAADTTTGGGGVAVTEGVVESDTGGGDEDDDDSHHSGVQVLPVVSSVPPSTAADAREAHLQQKPGRWDSAMRGAIDAEEEDEEEAAGGGALAADHLTSAAAAAAVTTVASSEIQQLQEQQPSSTTFGELNIQRRIQQSPFVEGIQTFAPRTVVTGFAYHPSMAFRGVAYGSNINSCEETIRLACAQVDALRERASAGTVTTTRSSCSSQLLSSSTVSVDGSHASTPASTLSLPATTEEPHSLSTLSATSPSVSFPTPPVVPSKDTAAVSPERGEGGGGAGARTTAEEEVILQPIVRRCRLNTSA